MGAATPVGELLLKSLRLLASPSVHLTRGEHTGCSVDLFGVELGPEGKGHR